MAESTNKGGIFWLRLPSSANQPLSVLTERALSMLFVLAVLGVLLLLMTTLSLGSIKDGIRYATIGLISALASGALGIAMGLLFGLPTLAARAAAISNANAGTAGIGATGNAQPTMNRMQPLYGDNTSIEQVADWLTKIIIGLGLTQFDAFTERFDSVATQVSAAMLGLPQAQASPVVGGSLLLCAFLLCFLASYLWSRRYLPIELAGARVDQLAAEERHIQRAEVMRTQQQKRDAGQNIDTLFASAQAVTAAAHDADFPEPVAPQKSLDPWKGQFGGQSEANDIELVAALSPMHIRSGYVAVDLRLRGVSTQARAKWAGKTARLYLHPSFPDPLRMLTLDAMGEVRLPLIVWGAFTVGAQLEDGTLLELDLAQLANAPPVFQIAG